MTVFDGEDRIAPKISGWVVQIWMVLVLGILSAGLPAFSVAQDKAGAQSLEEAVSIEQIDIKIGALESIIEKFSGKKQDQLAHELGVPEELIVQKIDSLIAVNSAYIRLKNAVVGFEKAANEKQTNIQIYENFRVQGMSKSPPYSLTFHDSVQAEISAAVKNSQNIELAIEILKKSIEDYKTQLSQKESEHRQLKEKVYKKARQDNSKIIIEYEILENVVLQIKTLLQALDYEIKRYEQEKISEQIQIQYLKEQEGFISANLHNDKADLDHQIQLIQKKEVQIQDEIKIFKEDQAQVELEWLNAQKNMNSAKTEQQRELAQSYLKQRDEWRRTYIIALELKQVALKLLARQKVIWQHRYAIVEKRFSRDKKIEIKAEAQKNSESLNQMLQIQQNYLVNLQKQITSIDNLLQEDGTTVNKDNFAGERDALKRQFERRLEFQSLVIVTDQIEQYLLAQLEKYMTKGFIENQFFEGLKILKKVWTFEVWVVDQRSVYVGKITIALLALALGLILARFLVHRIHIRFLASSQLKETTASAIHKVFSYFAYVLVFLFALRVVNIPLTAFAFLGGAIAIGLGFGAQNLINNFISGFIILGERPINIGDLIEVDGLLGKVEEIGARCTRVRTGENVHKLIPNSSFLEKNITNWTLSDNNIRTKIVVGVAYGSPVELVEKTLLKAVEAVGDVLDYPEPLVIFSDFGDNSLVFEVYFWVMVRALLEKRKIESRVRFEIDAQFRKENIVISFPQRDLHFDSDRPLSIQMVKPIPPEVSLKGE